MVSNDEAMMLSLYCKVENAKNKKNSIDEIINQIKTVKQFITSKTTKEAYAYGKKMVLKLLKHLSPNRIKGNLYMGPMLSVLLPERFSLNNFSKGLAPSAPN